MDALKSDGHVPRPGKGWLFALAHQVVEHVTESGPIGDGEELSGDLIIGQTWQSAVFSGELGVVASDQIAGLFENLVIEIAFL
jgi:hypothetical protein